jgi:hypothetical protein
MPTKFDEHSVAQRKAEESEFGPCKGVAKIDVKLHPDLKRAWYRSRPTGESA